MYKLKTNLEIFGKTLSFYQKKDSYPDYISSDDIVFYEFAIQNGLVEILTNIFIDMVFPDRSLEMLQNKLDVFNQNNEYSGNSLTKDILLSMGLIRVVFNQVYIATQISSALWSYRQDTNIDEKLAQLSEVQQTAIRFLLDYQLTIPSQGEILTSRLNDETLATKLIDSNLFELNENKLIFEGDNYSNPIKHFAKDILINIYFKLCNNGNLTENQVLNFINLVQFLNFGYYLPHLIQFIKEDSNFLNHIIELLSKEEDLDMSNIEWLKYETDSRTHRYENFDLENYPNYSIATSNTIEVIESINYIKNITHSSYEWQKHRKIYNCIIQLFLEQTNSLEHFKLKVYLENTEKPYLTYIIFDKLKNSFIDNFPQLVLYNTNYIPLIFKEINNLEINDSSLYKINCMSNFGRIEKDEKLEEFKTELCITLFNICFNKDVFYYTRADITPLSKTLNYFSKQLFNIPANATINYYKTKYEKIMLLLEELLVSIDSSLNFLDELIKEISNNFVDYKSKTHNLISLDYSIFQLLTDLLKIKSRLSYETVIPQHSGTESSEDINTLVAKLFIDHLNWYFTCTEVEISDHNNYENRRLGQAKLYNGQIGVELIDWNLVFILIENHSSLSEVQEHVTSNLVYNDFSLRDSDQTYNIKLFFKICCLAYINNSNEYKEIKDFDYPQYHETLERLILELATNFKDEEISYNSIFRVPHPMNNNRYSKTSRDLLFNAINEMSEQVATDFITDFFESSTDLGLMLEAINKIKNPAIVEIISSKIDDIDIEEYISKHVSLIDELEQSMIHAVNSSSNYTYARIFLDKVVQHHNERQYDEERIKLLAKRIKLLLALKEKDLEQIISFRNDINFKNVRLISFVYEAVYQIEELNDFTKAEELLRSISKTEAFDIGARLDLFRCILYNSDKTIDDKRNASVEWEAYVNSLSEDSNEHGFLHKFSSYINSLKCIVYGQVDEGRDNFYKHFDLVRDENRYNKYLIPIVIERLTKDERFIEYREYIINAEEHYEHKSLDIPELLSQALDENLPSADKGEIRRVLRITPKLKPKDIIRVLPNNSFHKLNEFVLESLISSLKMVMEKIHSVREKQSNGSYKLENQYNDLLAVILKSKFEYLNWQVTDQERVGLTQSGQDAGEADLIIQHMNNKFALIEPFRLAGRDKSVTQSHSKKTYDYCPNIENYYNVIYFIGTGSVDSCWESYKDDFISTDFPNDLKNFGDFKELTQKFSDIQKMRVAKTIHGHYNYFHIIVDLSDYQTV
ncbi:hypothetical protein ACT3TH_10480 [Psychrobacter sp. AOP22-C1-C5]|uniref:hypothetical protein n=1 Tax=Psychrobacter sp. AOP22-C1-C5 TaxID=3457716 RepID=UPI0040367CA6